MTQMAELDPRDQFLQAHAWVGSLIKATATDQFDAPTPCADWTVAELIGHIVATIDRAVAIAEETDVLAVPLVDSDTAHDAWAARHHEALARFSVAWKDDAIFDALVTVPWGTVPGRAALAGYIQEAVVHGWDLAVSTGQPSDAPDGLAEAALATAKVHIPAEMRGGPVPFDPPVTPRPEATATEKLANWVGRQM